MKPVKYQKERKVELLYKGKYKGFNYYIVNLGTHPTAYVEISKGNRYYEESYYDINDILAHGGLTYSESYLHAGEYAKEDSWFIGWDYAHCMDYIGIYDMLNMGVAINTTPLKKWTTGEIKTECEDVINQIIEGDEKHGREEDPNINS
jgi:hypothetical protein